MSVSLSDPSDVVGLPDHFSGGWRRDSCSLRLLPGTLDRRGVRAPAAAWGRRPRAGRRPEPDSGHAVSARASGRPRRHQRGERSRLPAHQRPGAGDRCDRARQRHRARAVDRRSPMEPHSRRVARGRRSGRAPDGHGRRQPVPQRSRRRLDGDRARLPRHRRRSRQERNPPRADRRVSRRQLHDRRRRRRDGARRGVSGARRSHRRFVSESRAQGRRLRHRGGRRAGVAERRRHNPRPRAWRCRRRERRPCASTKPSSCSPGRSRRPS